jgi:hypothetical protein
MPHHLSEAMLQIAINYCRNKNGVAVADGFGQIDNAIKYVIAAAENLLELARDPEVKPAPVFADEEMIDHGIEALHDPRVEAEPEKVSLVFNAMIQEAEPDERLPDQSFDFNPFDDIPAPQ